MTFAKIWNLVVSQSTALYCSHWFIQVTLASSWHSQASLSKPRMAAPRDSNCSSTQAKDWKYNMMMHWCWCCRAFQPKVQAKSKHQGLRAIASTWHVTDDCYQSVLWINTRDVMPLMCLKTRAATKFNFDMTSPFTIAVLGSAQREDSLWKSFYPDYLPIRSQ